MSRSNTSPNASKTRSHQSDSMTPLYEQIYRIVRRIPAGRVLSYGDVAALCSSSVSARTVGWAMARAPEGVPWHRVVNRKGRLSIGKRSVILQELQKNLLQAEGVRFIAPDQVDMDRHRWNPTEAGSGSR
ncbi:MAG: methyltransferase [Acidobacteria bacterium]|nr:MAG: methyltransferase [Acidobacteriota bacterium]